MNIRPLFVAALVVAPITPSAWAQFGTVDFRILPGSQYTYIPSGFSPIPDCDLNDDLQCDFEITGTFSLNELGSDTATIMNADLQLISPVPVTPIYPGQIVTSDRVEEWLEMQTLQLIPSIPEAIAYQSTTPEGIGDPFVISFDFPGFGSAGTMQGGYNVTPVDGDGLEFRVNLLRIPEPASWSLCLLMGSWTLVVRHQLKS